VESYQLPFAKIDILREDIAEVIFNDGVKIDEQMVEQYHSFLISHLQVPPSVSLKPRLVFQWP